jgi:selenocysteine lyase/cysteine desulfurase
MCGTPNIMGIIRLGYVLTLKQAILEKIIHNEEIISSYVTKCMIDLRQKYSNFDVVGLDERTDKGLPIYPVIIKKLHYNLITVLFNDIFGIQTGGGLSCAGTLGRLAGKIRYRWMVQSIVQLSND